MARAWSGLWSDRKAACTKTSRISHGELEEVFGCSDVPYRNFEFFHGISGDEEVTI